MIEESKQSVFVCFLSGKADSSSSESSTPSPSTHTTWQGQCWTHLFSYAVYRSVRSALLGVCVYSLFLCLQPLQVYQCLWAAEAEAHISGQTGECFSPSLLFCFSVSTAWRRSRCRIPSLSLLLSLPAGTFPLVPTGSHSLSPRTLTSSCWTLVAAHCTNDL